MNFTIFVIDDEKTIREGISLALRDLWTIRTFATAESAIEAMGTETPDLVLLDVGLPGMNGIEALEHIKKRDPDVVVIMITAYEDVDTVVACMKQGAHDYTVKPLVLDALEVSIRKGLERIRLRKQVRELQARALEERLPFFVGESDAMQQVMDLVKMVARSPDTPVLILGETGTGKELVASAIHTYSPLFEGPFVALNCASIPEHLLESELFGYEKGAFSGASSTGKHGLVEEASEGTLFLDEVGDLSDALQAKLLRFLEEGSFYRVGGTKEQHVSCRIVAATNRDLGAMIDGEKFRLDLYHRLSVVNVSVPSLAERQNDILPLAEHFLMRFNEKFDRDLVGLSELSKQALLAHRFTGHVRELRNLMERAALVARSAEVQPEDMGIGTLALSADGKDEDVKLDMPPLPEGGVELDGIHRNLERRYIEEALEQAGGNEKEAARLLGLNYHTFRYRKSKLSRN